MIRMKVTKERDWSVYAYDDLSDDYDDDNDHNDDEKEAQAYKELGLLMLLVGVAVLTFASLVYFAEKVQAIIISGLLVFFANLYWIGLHKRFGLDYQGGSGLGKDEFNLNFGSHMLRKLLVIKNIRLMKIYTHAGQPCRLLVFP